MKRSNVVFFSTLVMGALFSPQVHASVSYEGSWAVSQDQSPISSDDDRYACNRFSEAAEEELFSKDEIPMTAFDDALRCCPSCPITDCAYVSAHCCDEEDKQFVCTGGVTNCTDGSCAGFAC
jgi:hypothetical protein